MVLSAVSLFWMGFSVPATSFTPVEATLNARIPPLKCLRAVAAFLQADVRLFMKDAEHLLRARGVELLARALAGDVLGLADMGQRAELFGFALAGVDSDDRDPGVGRVLDGILERIRIRQRDDNAIDLRGDIVLDQLCLLLGSGLPPDLSVMP